MSPTAQPTSDVVALTQQLIRNRCVNDGTEGSGGEVRNADLLCSYLEGSGLDLQRYEPAPGRTSLVVRIEGTDPDTPTLCLMGHTDVVPANAERWQHDPFGGDLEDGVLWGRGAVDMFNNTASMAVATKRLAASGFRPRGTLIYFAVADEEATGAHGAEHLTLREPDAVRCDYCLTEAGGFPVRTPDGVRLPFLREEKGPMWATLRVTGTPGHGSMPFGTDNALLKAAEVVRRIGAYRPPTTLDDAWRSFVHGMGIPTELAGALLDHDTFDASLEHLPAGLAKMAYSCTHTTITPTMVSSGSKTNIIPEVADIALDIRVLPGDDEDVVRRMVADAIGDAADGVEFSIERTDELASASPASSPLVDSVGRVVERFYAGARLLPLRMVGSTDARFFRRTFGTSAYGFGMFSERIALDDLAAMTHGDDERIDIDSLDMSVELWDAVARDFLG